MSSTLVKLADSMEATSSGGGGASAVAVELNCTCNAFLSAAEIVPGPGGDVPLELSMMFQA